MSISTDQEHSWALLKIDDEKCNLDLATLGNAYSTLLSEEHPKREFWQTPGFVIAGFSISLATGLVFGLTKCLGMCP